MTWKQIAEQADWIDDLLRFWEQKKADVLRQDEVYAAYCERFDASGKLPQHRLSIRTFYHQLARMRAIEANEPSDPDKAQEYWSHHRRDYRRLESDLLFE